MAGSKGGFKIKLEGDEEEGGGANTCTAEGKAAPFFAELDPNGVGGRSGGASGTVTAQSGKPAGREKGGDGGDRGRGAPPGREKNDEKDGGGVSGIFSKLVGGLVRGGGGDDGSGSADGGLDYEDDVPYGLRVGSSVGRFGIGGERRPVEPVRRRSDAVDDEGGVSYSLGAGRSRFDAAPNGIDSGDIGGAANKGPKDERRLVEPVLGSGVSKGKEENGSMQLASSSSFFAAEEKEKKSSPPGGSRRGRRNQGGDAPSSLRPSSPRGSKLGRRPRRRSGRRREVLLRRRL